ncbi:helix-turn-helix domain-containing protein [Pararhodobacter sp. SW119]|uniref:helix-turn-helix domain-containing protein n=1 Tax=Pararhodobacter sp. SW119 TaxID=2780075 RepID=UPI001ADED322|nr:helix-turn-helix domain-containing protein [Pararhodobacter sp. SW119]
MVQFKDHLGVAELQAGWRASKDATLARHYQVIWPLAQGRSRAEVARLTGFVRRWVEELAARYNRFGPSSLGDRRRGNGSKPKILTPEILAMLRERVKTPPDDGGVWTAKKVAAVIAATLGVPRVAEQRGWEALRAIDWTIQRPRPRVLTPALNASGGGSYCRSHGRLSHRRSHPERPGKDSRKLRGSPSINPDRGAAPLPADAQRNSSLASLVSGGTARESTVERFELIL